MNRLFWLNDNHHWELVLESDNDKDVMLQAQHLGLSNVLGIVGYACYPKAPLGMQWTRYTRYTGGCKRSPVSHADIPKPIKLLEMFHEPHASS